MPVFFGDQVRVPEGAVERLGTTIVCISSSQAPCLAPCIRRWNCRRRLEVGFNIIEDLEEISTVLVST
jgi:hypothetical protein